MNHENHIGIIGNGGQADEAHAYTKKEVGFRAINSQYIDNESVHNLIDIENPDTGEIDTPVHIAVGAPALRRELEEKWPGQKYETIISEHAIVDKSASIGEGTLIAPRAVITTNVKLGRHVIVNVAATVQHDTTIGDFSTIGPGVNIGGNVEIGDGVFIGIGANISNSIKIADGVVIGAGATLIKNADVENGVYVGVPAKLMKQNEEWLREI